MKPNYSYIQPHFSVRNYFEKNTSSSYESVADDFRGGIDFNPSKNISIDILETVFEIKNNLGVVISKPGNGKSRFLKEILLRALDKGKQAIFIDLKEVDLLLTLEESIKKLILDCEELEDEMEEYVFMRERILKTGSFNFINGPEKAIICLDALDELNPKDYVVVIRKIKSFLKGFPQIKILLSCRKYICKKYTYLLNELSPTYIELYPFYYFRIEKYLKEKGFKDTEVELVFQKFKAGFQREIVIGSPRILEIFVSVYQDEGLKSALSKTKAEWLDAFIYKKLKIEDRLINVNQVEMVKRVLEKLALIMEIYHKNEITKDELMTFFDDVNSNLSASFLQQFPLHQFYERSLLIDFGNTIQFENAELQEYLAAKEISRLGEVGQISFDLIFNEDLSEFHIAWFNTLSYLVDFSGVLQLKIIEFVVKRDSLLDLKIIPYILSTAPNRLDELALKKNWLFQKILDQFNFSQRYIYRDLADKLTFYYESDQESFLKKCATSKDFVCLTNSILLIGRIINEGLQVDIEFWKKRLIEILNSETVRENLFHSCIETLGKFKEIEIFENEYTLENVNSSGINNLVRVYYKTVQSIDPNHTYTIDLLIEELKRDRTGNTSDGIIAVKSKEGIKYLLKKLLKFYEGEELFDFRIESEVFFETFIKNIEGVYDLEVSSLLKKLKPSNHNDHLYIEVLKLLCEKEDDYMFSFLNESGVPQNNGH